MEESYECHITIAPVFDEKLQLVNQLATSQHFKLAKLIMVKEDKSEETSKRDTFMTGHSVSYALLRQRMRLLCKLLVEHDIPIYRYKIEKIMMDSRVEDSLRMISDG